MKSMKIKINAEQPLKEVVKELERFHGKRFEFVNLEAESDLWLLFNSFNVTGWSCDCDLDLFTNYKTVTLSEIKEMV